MSVPSFTTFLTEDGEFVPPAPVEASGKVMLDELVRLSAALSPLRTR